MKPPQQKTPYKIGQKVKIKPRKDIIKTLDNENYGTHGVYWNNSRMQNFCGRIVTISNVNKTYKNTYSYTMDELNKETESYWTFQHDWIDAIPLLPEELFNV